MDTAREDVSKTAAGTGDRNRDDVKRDSSHVIIGRRRICMAGVRVQRLPHRLAVSHEVKLRKHLLLTIKPTNCESHSYKTLKTRSLPITYLYTHTSAFRQHRSFIHQLNHPPRKILAPVPARPTIPPNAYTKIRPSYVTVSTTNIHALSTTGAPPDSSLVLLNINNSGPFALSERLGRIARCYSTVSPRKRNCWWSFWDSQL